MRRNGWVSLLAVSLLFVSAQAASAQFKFGPRAAYGTDYDIAIGGMATLGFNTVLFEGAGPLTGALAFDYFLDCPFNESVFGADYSCSFFEISPTAYVPFGSGLYAGAGLNFARFSADVSTNTPIGNISGGGSSSDIGLAIHGGYMFDLGGQTGVADARFSLAGSEQLVLAFAFLFGGSN